MCPSKKNDASELKPVYQHFRAKVSPHLGKLMKKSDAIRKQFMPAKEELITFGTDAPFEEGKLNHGIYGLERIYADRAVLTPYFECRAYCRYCFKKKRTLAGNAERMSDQNIDDAVAYIKSDSRIKTVLITGGDPLIDPSLVKKVLDKVITIPHVNYIRVGTRNILFDPKAVTDDVADMLSAYNSVNPENISESKNLSVGLSLNHIDELSPEVIRATRRLINRGINIRGQIALLKGVNDSAHDIQRLIEGFLSVGIIPYYLLHCMPVTGTKHFRTSVQKGLDILESLASHSGVTAPLYVYVTPVGKIRISPGHKLDYKMINGERFIRKTTPYKAEDFFKFANKTELPLLHEISEEGYLVSHYLDGNDD